MENIVKSQKSEVVQQIKMLRNKYQANIADVTWIRTLAITLELKALIAFLSDESPREYIELIASEDFGLEEELQNVV